MKFNLCTNDSDVAMYTEAELSGESLPKKCKDCDSNEFRYQYHKNKVENMIAATEEVNKKLAQLNLKNQRLCTVLVTVFKPKQQSTSPGLNPLSATLDEKEKNNNNILEQINLLFGNNSGTRTPAMSEEESLKNLLNNNMNFQLMAKLLMNASEQPQ